MAVTINCDIGEAFGIYRMGDDEACMPYVRRKTLTRRRGVRGVAFSSAISASPRAKLVDARPKAWHDERGADGAGPRS